MSRITKIPNDILETLAYHTQVSSIDRRMACELLASRELLDAFAPKNIPKGADINVIMDMLEGRFSLSQDASDLLRGLIQDA